MQVSARVETVFLIKHQLRAGLCAGCPQELCFPCLRASSWDLPLGEADTGPAGPGRSLNSEPSTSALLLPILPKALLARTFPVPVFPVSCSHGGAVMTVASSAAGRPFPGAFSRDEPLVARRS